MPRELTALVVDPASRMRKLLKDSLQETGLADFMFVEAENGADALKRFKPGTLDIMFLDMLMPEMDGVEFLHKLHFKHAEIPPAVMVTSETNKERLMAAINHVGVEALIFKPPNAARLKNDLKDLIKYMPYKHEHWALSHGLLVEQAMREMLTKTCNLETVPEPTEQQVGTGDVVFATIPVRGAVKWTVVLGFEREAAEQAAARFAMDEISFDDPDIGDVIGELANQVAGYLKKLLDEKGVIVDISLPTVLRARGIELLIQPRNRSRVDQVCFDSPMGKFWVGVTVGDNSGIIL
jgi:two-component system, chemotaxis family, chemotaxis protein CheY